MTRRKIITWACILLVGSGAVLVPSAHTMFVRYRVNRQADQLRAMLVQTGGRYPRVSVWQSTRPDVMLVGFVKTKQDRLELLGRVKAVLGASEGESAFSVQVVSPGGNVPGFSDDFWETK